jgi:hypothetical protein
MPHAFDIRMLYAAHSDLIPYARKLDLNWVVPVSMGHKGNAPEDDPPVFMKGYPRLAPRRRALTARIKAEQARISRMIALSKKNGLKVMLHSYEPSLPEGFQEAYPSLYSREIREYVRTGPPAVGCNRQLCVARPEVREALAAKMEELIRLFPDMDAFSYTNNESSSTTKLVHRCDVCRDVPYARTMKMLHDALAEGIRRSGRPVRLFDRCWGAHETDFMFYDRFNKMIDFGIVEGDKSWMKAYATCFKPSRLHFIPSRDNPAYIKLMKHSDTGFLYKASWADCNIHHPLNPWIGAYPGHDQICELSFEMLRDASRDFYVMGRELQRRARLARSRKVDGLAAVPMSWGAQERWGSFSNWSLNEANLIVFAALCRNPDAPLERIVADYLKQRYGRPLPPEMTRLILDSEDVAAGAMNLRGAQVGGESLSDCYYQLMRYAPMRPGWEARIRPTPANRAATMRDKAHSVARAKDMLAQIDTLKARLPRRAYEEFHACFDTLLAKTLRFQLTHDIFLTLWGIKDGLVKPTVAELDALLVKVRRLEKLGVAWV